MHDPMTVAHEIKFPWYSDRPWPKKYRRDPSAWGRKQGWKKMTPVERSHRSEMCPEGYRNTFITIWHVDPEKDGSDDSCGYGYVRLTKMQIEKLRNACWHEAHNPHFLCCSKKEWDGTYAEAESLHRGLVLLVCRALRIRITFDEASKYAAESTHIIDCGKTGNEFCFLPGYHSNSEKDRESDREDQFLQLLCGVARNIITDRRPWWKHPKWHFWHWKIQVHALTHFKRWAFSRCSKCGKGFSWGYAPVTNSWNGTGPKWFRSEKDVFHSDCNHPANDCVCSAESTN